MNLAHVLSKSGEVEEPVRLPLPQLRDLCRK